MSRLKLFRRGAAVALAILLTPGLASAQDADSFSISGTFRGLGIGGIAIINDIEYPGITGSDLYEVYANAHEHTWTLTLHGLKYEYSESIDGYLEIYITRVHATSFDFQFFGPDAAVLNAAVSGQLSGGGLTGGAFLELRSYFNSATLGRSAVFDVGLRPLDWEGVWFYVTGQIDGGFPVHEYPVVEPRLGSTDYSTITDWRPGSFGGLASYDDLVNLGSSVPPVLPPLPPPPPTLGIADASVREGDKGTTRILLAVTLSRGSDDMVTVNYRTASGTALMKSDYTPTSGTLTFQPGDTSRTISIAIKGDRKREPNEYFFVQLHRAVGAPIGDAAAGVTILNDD